MSLGKIRSHEEIRRSLQRLTRPDAPYIKRPQDLSLRDVANWFGVDRKLVYLHKDGRPLNDFWQKAYSDFFHLWDNGMLRIEFDLRGKKILVRCKPVVPPKKKLKPYIEFEDMSLRLDT